jgi:mono/diheme cytochrome c family protein
MRQDLSTILVALVVVGLAVAAPAQQGTPRPNLRVDVVPPQNVSFDGAELYGAYCASCHGKDLKGFGPAWRLTATAPTDLTLCAVAYRTAERRVKHVATAIRSGHGQLAVGHSVKVEQLEMPDWATIFRALPPHNDIAGQQRVNAIAGYVVSLQQEVR